MSKEKEQGLRYSEGKIRYDLIPPEAKLFLARVLTQGAQKYPERNWEKGMRWGECLRALQNHLTKWEMGMMYDQESGEPHLAHVMWNAMALLVYEQRGLGNDDRGECEYDFATMEELSTLKVESKPPREETLRALGYEDVDPEKLGTLPLPQAALAEPLSEDDGRTYSEEQPSTSTCSCRACALPFSRKK